MMPISTTAEHAVDEALAGLSTESNGLSWGLESLDEMIGQVQPARLITFGARSGNGKSTLLLNWLNYLYGDAVLDPVTGGLANVVYLGTEMAPGQLMRKWAALRLGLNEDSVLSNSWGALPEGSMRSVRTELMLLGMRERQVWMPPCYHPSVSEILELINQADDRGCKTVVFDHLHRIRPEGREDRWTVLERAVRELKTAATKRNMRIVMACQLHRDGDGVFDRYRPPYLGSFLGSAAIEAESDIALGIFRPLKKMTLKQERCVRSGELPLSDFAMYDTMAVKCLKHRHNGPAVDRVVRLKIVDSRIGDFPNVPVAPLGAGDAWEPDENEAVPF